MSAFVWMSVSFPATAAAKESARASNKPSAANARASSAFTSATRSRISWAKLSAFVWMSVSFPATAVAKESARSFNKPSAVIARASSSSMLSCNVSAAVVNCPNDARWPAAVASAADTFPVAETSPVTLTSAPSVVSPETLRVEPIVTAPSKSDVWYTSKEVASKSPIVPAGETKLLVTSMFWMFASSASIVCASTASNDEVLAWICAEPKSTKDQPASRFTVPEPLSSK